METEYIKPKAKTIFVSYDVEDVDSLVAYRTLEQATEDMEIGDEDVLAVYELVKLIEVKSSRKITKKTIDI